MATFNIPLPQLQTLFLIFLRVSAIIMTVPFFGSKNVPFIFKAGLAVSISIILFQVLKPDPVPFQSNMVPFIVGAVGEVMIGIIIGLAVNLVFAGIKLAGQLAGFQMSFAIANVMDPVTGQQSSIIGETYHFFAMVVFLTINGHHALISSMAESFRFVPIFGVTISGPLVERFMALVGNMFVIAVKVGAPVIVALLLTTVALGLVARTVPQMNVFFVAMPLKILAGLLFLGFSFTYFLTFLKQITSDLGRDILLLLEAMG